MYLESQRQIRCDFLLVLYSKNNPGTHSALVWEGLVFTKRLFYALMDAVIDYYFHILVF